MANVDTGLGWSAAQNFIRTAPGFLADLGLRDAFSDTVGVYTGSTPNAETVISQGRYIGTSDGTASYVMVKDAYPVVVRCYPGASTWRVVFIGTAEALSGGLSWVGCKVGSTVRQGSGSTTLDSTTGLRYVDIAPPLQPAERPGFVGNPSISYSSLRECLDSVVSVYEPSYKLYEGPCVAMIAKWRNLDGDTRYSTVLISTNDLYITQSHDNTDPATDATTFGARWQNTTFRISLYGQYEFGAKNPTIPIEDFTTAYPGPISASTLFEACCRIANIIVGASPDPYGGDAQPGGGEGNPDEDEEIDFSTPPTVGSYVGFFRMWNPTETELRQLASWMWSSAFDLDTFKRIFSAPIDAILGLSLVPVQPAGIGGYTIVLGGIDTQISAFTVTNRYVTLNCGSLTVDERWGAYLDYAPYTKMSIFLPYIGFRDISTDDVMGKTVELQYTVDVLSGACVAELKCGGSVLYSWQGNCAQQLPITSADWSNALSAALGLAGTAATAIVTGGGSLPLAGTVASATVNALSLKPRMERGGSVSGAAGAMAGQVPYLVRERPEQAVPGRQNHFIGYPSFTTVTLGSIAGYTEVESIHLEGIPATAAELSELESILKEGFIL